MNVVLVMVSHLLLSGAVVSTYSLLMGFVSIYGLIVKLKDIKEEIQKSSHEMAGGKVNTNIVLWWAGTFLGKRLHDIMRGKLSRYTFDSEWSQLAKAKKEVRSLACLQNIESCFLAICWNSWQRIRNYCLMKIFMYMFC